MAPTRRALFAGLAAVPVASAAAAAGIPPAAAAPRVAAFARFKRVRVVNPDDSAQFVEVDVPIAGVDMAP